jgi:hypothetical protein
LWVQLRVAEMKVKLTGAAAEQLFVGFQLNCDDFKEIHVGINDGYNYVIKEPPSAQWIPVSCCLAHCINDKKKHPPPTLEIKEININIVSKSGKTPTGYIDDFILTAGGTPESLWGTAMAMDGDRLKRTADPAKSGFTFNDAMETALEEALRKTVTKPEAGTVLAYAAGRNASSFVDALKAAATRRTVTAAAEPEGLKISGLGDVRLFLPYAMGKKAGETVLIALPARAMMWAPPADAVLISKRCLAQGALPIWILPAAPAGMKEGEAKRVGEANNGFTKELAKLGVPTVDAQFAVKDVGNAWDGQELSTAGWEAVAKLAAAAMTHVERYVRGR